VSFTAAQATLKKKAAGTLATFIMGFKGSTDFTKLAPKTKKDYLRYLDAIEAKFGTMPRAALEQQRARGVFKDWRDEIAEKSGDRTADYLWTVLARVLSCAKDRGKLTSNVCEKGGRLYEADRNDNVWTAAHEKAFYEKAPAHLHLALMLGLWTGQREGDLLRLTWMQYDGTHIRLRQSKGGRRVTIPVGKPLKAALDKLKADLIEENDGKLPDGPILRTSRGTTWTEDGFRSSFAAAKDDASIEGLTFHDTRGTAVTRLALAGSSEAEIATITGHSLKTVSEILDAHYLSRDVVLAESAIAKLEGASQD
jgi:integrase